MHFRIVGYFSNKIQRKEAYDVSDKCMLMYVFVFCYTEQLAEIQKASLSSLMCDHMTFARIHENAFKPTSAQ